MKDNSVAMIMIIFLAVVIVRKERADVDDSLKCVWLWLVGSSICFTFWYSNKLQEEEEKFNETC